MSSATTNTLAARTAMQKKAAVPLALLQAPVQHALQLLRALLQDPGLHNILQRQQHTLLKQTITCMHEGY